MVENKKKYNGIEFENDLELNVYDAELRELDPQIGRWWEIDPKTDEMYMWSTYASNFDNPIRYEDPLGDEPDEQCCGEWLNKVWTGVKERVSEYTSSEGLMSLAFPVTSLANSLVNDPKGTANGIGQTLYNGSLFGTVNNVVNNPKELGKSFVDAAAVVVTDKVVGSVSKVGSGNLTEVKAPEVKGLGNPFKNSTLKEVETAMKKHVESGKLIEKPSAPGNKAYQNTKSKYSYNLDPGSIGKIGRKEAPHVDVNYPNPKPKNVPPKKKLPTLNEK